MKRLILAAAALIACTFTQAQDSTKVLPEGTIITVAIQQDISSKTAKSGDMVEFLTAEPVIVGDRVLVQKGEKVTGIVKDVEKPRSLGKGGSLNLDINYLRLASGKNVRLQGESKTQGKNATTAGMVVGGLFKKGKNVEYKRGDTFTVFVSADTVIQ